MNVQAPPYFGRVVHDLTIEPELPQVKIPSSDGPKRIVKSTSNPSPKHPAHHHQSSSHKDTESSKTSKKKESKRRTWKKPKDKPKRPLSAYNLFFQSERNRIIASIPGTIVDDGIPEEVKKRKHHKVHGKIGFVALARSIANKWRQMDSNERKMYTDQAEMEKARYQKALDAWVQAKAERGELPNKRKKPEKLSLTSRDAALTALLKTTPDDTYKMMQEILKDNDCPSPVKKRKKSKTKTETKSTNKRRKKRESPASTNATNTGNKLNDTNKRPLLPSSVTCGKLEWFDSYMDEEVDLETDKKHPIDCISEDFFDQIPMDENDDASSTVSDDDSLGDALDRYMDEYPVDIITHEMMQDETNSL